MKYIATDVDGVLTDGRFTLDINGNETKTVCYRDLDAIGVGRRNNIEFIFVTGESGEMVHRLAARFKVDIVHEGAKDKLTVIKAICEKYGLSKDELVYIGDSDRDVPALAYLSNSFCPRDASENAKKAAKRIIDVNGGFGVLSEVVNLQIVKR